VVGGRILRVFRFRSQGVDFDGFLRSQMIPDLRAMTGLVDVHAGRRDRDQGDDRIVATVWEDRDAMIVAVGETVETSPFHPERLGDTTERQLDVLEIRIDLPFATDQPPALLRMFRGEVKPGELESYIAEARAGTLADAEAGRGPVTLYLAADPPDRFVTVSLWPSWEAIATATGGDIHRPTITKDSSRLVTTEVAHYELVPDAN
jgi:heme-degrading monooxygenase HmoA